MSLLAVESVSSVSPINISDASNKNVLGKSKLTRSDEVAPSTEAAGSADDSSRLNIGANVLVPVPQNSPNSASLYVGELDPSVTEAMLFELFNNIGAVASIRVCRDAVTRRSLGYAYVNFHNSSDGERALEELNYTLIKGKPCRIMWSQRDPSLRKTGTGNVFIKNLDSSIDNKALHDTFTAFGNILSCKVAVDELGNSKGYGFVHYKTSESAEAAIKHVNGMLLNNKKVYVGHHVSKKDRQSKFDAMKANFTNIYVKNINPEISEAEFEELFRKFGNVTSLSLSVDENGKSRGFGFVNYENHEDAARAVGELHDTEYKDRKLYVSRAQKKHEREEELKKQYEQAKLDKLNKYNGINLFVKNLDDDIDDERLRQEFSIFGTITSAKIMVDDNGKSKGFGFVCFSSPDEATKAITEMNQRMVSGKPLYVALAQRKDVRRSQLESQINARNQLRMQQQAAAAGMPPQYGIAGAPMFYGQGPGFMPAGPVTDRGIPFPQPGIVSSRPRWVPQQAGQPNGQAIPQMYSGMSGYNAYLTMQGRPQRSGQISRSPQGLPSRPIMSMGMRPAPAGARVYRIGSNIRNGTRDGIDVGNDNQLTAAALAAASPENQKQMLGEALYPKVQAQEVNFAGKITGMLLEMDNSELLHLIEDDVALRAKVEEALIVLKEYQKDYSVQDQTIEINT
ncbi:hypothetical protein PNEG_03000 [Pneumocystis murina B123]|uniref:Polyadenylate-binding protein n=1 Tax=Pneumocystis murina (strain B123) TaxID=1069680 RepID=M7NIT8_PNEMU|nr:hypothetical protein PNEG_03000 [Pneumocystis murina B123]EMR08518.1 hypothetical protein PNEG_03000 [Pneumocystis murina B123]